LKPKARKALEQIIRQVQKTNSLDILASLDAIDYDCQVVPARQFLEDEYYLGRSVKNLSESWKQVFEDVFAPQSTIGTLILTGAIGTGKSTFAATCFCRKLYELTCLKDPALFHGLLPKSKIIFGIYNITLDKADDVTLMIEQFIKDSQYFQEICPPRDRPRYPLYIAEKRLEISTGSLSTHALGDNVLGFILDECNFFKKVVTPDSATEKTRAHQLFNEARTRQVSRFMKAGKIPGLNILISSRKFQSSFLDEFIDNVKKDAELQKHIKVVEFALWQTKNPNDFSGESFDVLVGTERYPSRVLEFEEIIDEEDAVVVRVPIEYYEQFITDPDLALRDIAGVSTAGSSAFFPVKSRILDCVDSMRTHPFTRPVITIPLMSDQSIQEYFQERKLCHITNSMWVPLIHPNIERHIHIDLAVTEECIGMSMTHPYEMNDGRFGVYADFMLRIKPPTVGELELSSVIEFVKLLKNTYHFKIKKVTFDQWQSRMPIQLLLQAGFEAECLSVDLAHYTHLKTCINERRLNMYEYSPIITELEKLQKDPAGGRPFHKVGENDDVSDSLAATVSRCYNVESIRTKKGSLKKDKVTLDNQQVNPMIISVNSDHNQEEFRIK
jgi:hypothetical protein